MTGVYYAAAELSSQGCLVTVTARNAPTVDMMVSTPNLKKTTNVQVKSNKAGGNQSFWLLSKEARRSLPNLTYIFVNLKKNERPDFYIVDSGTVAKKMSIERTKSGIWYAFGRDERYKDRWDLFK